MNSLKGLAHVLETGANEIHIDEAIRRKAVIPIQRMLDFSSKLKPAAAPGKTRKSARKEHAVTA